ncbi:MAG: hypothetical protein QM783_14775 [Phycisphaerales bacterium]
MSIHHTPRLSAVPMIMCPFADTSETIESRPSTRGSSVWPPEAVQRAAHTCPSVMAA